jgi:hypothetical protein
MIFHNLPVGVKVEGCDNEWRRVCDDCAQRSCQETSKRPNSRLGGLVIFHKNAPLALLMVCALVLGE